MQRTSRAPAPAAPMFVALLASVLSGSGLAVALLASVQAGSGLWLEDLAFILGGFAFLYCSLDRASYVSSR